MPDLDWKLIWKKVLRDSKLFKHSVSGNKVIVRCPTKFSKEGKFSITVEPKFNDDSIDLDVLSFNDNIELTDLSIDQKSDNINKDDYESVNKLIEEMVLQWETKNRLLHNEVIYSSDIENEEEAIATIIELINSEATTSASYFDNITEQLTDELIGLQKESFLRNYKRIKSLNKHIFKIVESVLSKYSLHSLYNEDVDNKNIKSFYNENNDLIAVVSLENNILSVDISDNISIKVNTLNSDEDIEKELESNLDNLSIDSNNLNELDSLSLSNNIYAVPSSPNRISNLVERMVKIEKAICKRGFIYEKSKSKKQFR